MAAQELMDGPSQRNLCDVCAGDRTKDYDEEDGFRGCRCKPAPCPPHDFSTPSFPSGWKVHHFRNGHYWLICQHCGFSMMTRGA